MRAITIKHTVDYRDQPLATVVNFPGLDAELSPAQLRALSVALAAAADECEALAKETRRYGPARREYQITAA